jgi:hypothetical protein
MKHAAVAASLLAAAAVPAVANDFEPIMRQYLEAEIAGWAADPVLVAAIKARNAETEGLSQDQIDALDTAWRAEIGSADTPTISPIIANAASEFLRERVAASNGAMTEAFAMDARGLNAAVSDVTSDFWQGDEDKFQQTFGVGAGAVHISEVELDESTQTYQAQVSLTIVDPETQAPLGALTIGVNPEALF